MPRMDITVYRYCRECGYTYAPKSAPKRPCPKCNSIEVRGTALPNCIYYENGKCNSEDVPSEECDEPYGYTGENCPVLSEDSDEDRVIKEVLKLASRTQELIKGLSIEIHRN